jgi:Activator of Hsp90 ATPase homolog 1-like protein
VQCEVLACEPPKLLRYSWKGGADSNPAYGSRLDSTVTWTLTPVECGTHLHMVHDGFVFPGNQFAYDAMSPGRGRCWTVSPASPRRTEARRCAFHTSWSIRVPWPGGSGARGVGCGRRVPSAAAPF